MLVASVRVSEVAEQKMSAQFGRWNLDGGPVDSHYLERVTTALGPYGPDGGTSYHDTNLSILYHAFHTNKESRLEAQPYISVSGAVITWDGRLDNRAELITELRGSLTTGSADVVIVAAAYEKWGANCFAKVIGDWALSIWNSSNRSLLLAKDSIGTRHLYYSFDRNQITWSTVMDPLVRFCGKTLELNEEYIAGWLSMFPAVHLTPCVGVHSVPPSSYVLLRPEKQSVSKYWDFDPKNRIRYRSDAEYEEHFRSVFGTAVQRRLRSDRPVLAELSGGRDSSSIVCMADRIIAWGDAEFQRLDTVSYYDDDEPNWNERPYFTKVEEKRGRAGWHINIGPENPEQRAELEITSKLSANRFADTPAAAYSCLPQFKSCLSSQGNRVLLSGIGGDEVMGGVPTPTPELEDLIARAQLGTLAHRLKAWAITTRKPWLHLFCEAARRFLPPSLVGIPKYLHSAPWLHSKFVKHHWAALAGYPSRTKLFGPLPSFQENLGAIESLRRQMACYSLPFDPVFEKRYPYSDRDLLEFVFAIPREQLVRPRQRRSLMRRALIGIVPDEILNRKTKAFVIRAPLVAVSRDWSKLAGTKQAIESSLLGIIDPNRISDTLQNVQYGGNVSMVALVRTIVLEGWLRELRVSGMVNIDTIRKAKSPPPRAHTDHGKDPLRSTCKRKRKL
jgi:asparagine synthase (glutamine-hydrolysing)